MAETSPPVPPRRSRFGCLLPFAFIALLLSVLVNVLLGYLLIKDVGSLDTDSTSLEEKFYLGDKDASDKIAVVRLEGVILDSTSHYPIKQMEKAAKDKHVKAVVLRIDSPGGSVTASEELYQCVVNLRDNTGRRFAATGPKPVSVSMGGLAASGGYYVASAGKPIAAEASTITGSIGVFAALPNVAKLANDNGVKVVLIKAGDIKASGSFFHDMSPQERQTWQDTVDSAYDLFLTRVAAGRPLTKPQLRDDVLFEKQITERDDKGNVKVEKGKPVMAKYSRKRADGGTFTAEQALKYGLIDKVDDLPGAIRTAASAAGLSQFKAVIYDKEPGLLDLFLKTQSRATENALDLRGLAGTLTPRLWYLSASADGAILAPERP
jgi:protease IV